MCDMNTKDGASIFGEYAEKLYKNILGITQKEFSKKTGIAESTISTWKKKGFKGAQVGEGQIMIIAMYYGESITDADELKKKFGELIHFDDSEIEKLVGNRFKPDKIEECIRKAQNVLKHRYKAIEAGNFEKNLNEDQKAIREKFMEEHYPMFLKELRENLNKTENMRELNDNLTETDNSDASISEITLDKSEIVGMTKKEDSQKQCEDTDSVENSPKQCEATDSVEENAPKQCEDTDSVEDSPKQCEATDSVEENALKQCETIDSVGKTAIELPLVGNSIIKARDEYNKAHKLKKKDKKRIQHLECAANLGLAEAMYELGVAYQSGIGVDKNSEKAVEYFFQAGKMKLGKAVFELKEYYQSKIGIVKKSRTKAAWLLMVLDANNYEQEKYDVDISLDLPLKFEKKEKQKYIERWESFSPETDEDRKLIELIEIWGGIK